MSEQDGDPIPCHWCDDPIYGLLGLGEVEVEVEVMDNGDGQGFTEVVDGHTAAGYAPSRMCGFCTLDRLRITACKLHDMEPIEGMDPAKFDYGSTTDLDDAWCSSLGSLSMVFYLPCSRVLHVLLRDGRYRCIWGG